MEIGDLEIKIFQDTISENSKYDFSDYSMNSLKRRITKVMDEYKLEFDGLIQLMGTDSDFLEDIVKHVTVNTTELFRDPAVWRKLLYQVLPRYNHLPAINIWHPGCSTGQEVYSMMIILDHAGLLEKSNIYASDINSDVMVAAEAGSYRFRFNKEYIENYNIVFGNSNETSVKDNPNSWKKYFKIDETRDIITMQEYLRKKPHYSKIDLVKNKHSFDLNFDLIICRNVIIYFNYELQNRVLKMFHTSLATNGCLLLGLHESIIGPYSNLFSKDEQFYYKNILK